MEVNTDELVLKLKEYAVDPVILELLEEFKESGIIGKLTITGKIVQHFILRVEELASDIDAVGKHGSAKRESIIKVLDDMIKLPMLLEPFDDNFIGIVIDMIIGWYNKQFGNGWIVKIKSIL